MFEKPKLKPMQALMESLGFEETDLDANRAGELGPNQVVKLKKLQWAEQRRSLTKACIGSVIALFGILLAVTANESTLIKLGGMFTFGYIGYAFISSAWRDLQEANKYKFDIDSGRVEQIEGRVQLDILTVTGTYEGTKIDHLLYVEDKEWSLDKETFLGFKNGDPYAIYFAPHARTILSVEWLREPMPTQAPADSTDALETPSSEKHKRSP